MGFTLPTGAKAPDFRLPAHDGKIYDYKGLRGSNGTLVFFTCNHCPYVVNSEDRQKALYGKCIGWGISMVAIHSNETKDHPTDTFDAVKERMKEKGFQWISLHDEDQLMARTFGAERTPHYFLFNPKDELVYSGRMDNSPRDVTKVQTHELEDAIQAMLTGKPIPVTRTDSIGCNIKWWDREKHWMPAEACDLDYLYTRIPKPEA